MGNTFPPLCNIHDVLVMPLFSFSLSVSVEEDIYTRRTWPSFVGL